MDLSRTVYSRDLKIAAMRAVDVGAMMAGIARKYQVSPHMERWRGEWRVKGDLAFPGVGRRGAHLPAVEEARRVAELERKIGQLTMENDFLKKGLAAFQGASPASRRQCEDACLKKLRKPRRKVKP